MPWETYLGWRLRPALDSYNRDSDSFSKTQSASTVNAIYGDREGNLWVGEANDGLSRLRQGLFTSYTQQQGLADRLRDYRASGQQGGYLWIGSTKGLNHFRDGKFSVLPLDGSSDSDQRYRPCRGDEDGTVWVAAGDRLYRLQYDKQCGGESCLPKPTPVPNEALVGSTIKVLLADRQGAIRIGTGSDGVFIYKDRKFTNYSTANGLSNNAIRGLAEVTTEASGSAPKVAG